MDSKDNRTEKRKLGDIGENVACEYLRREGCEIVERNYLKKWGEIDIIAKKNGLIHFVEVKSASRENLKSFGTRETEYRPEDNMHPWKIKRLHRAIQTYLMDRKVDLDWQLDLVVVKVNEKNRIAKAEILENIVI